MNRFRFFAFRVLLIVSILLTCSSLIAAGLRIVYEGTDGDDTQITLGTPDPDTISQYGRAGNDTLYIAGHSHNDWLMQDGGDGHDNLSIKGADGNDQIFQLGGNGNDSQAVDAGFDDDWVYQSGGPGDDVMYLRGSFGNDYLYQSGGTGDDSLRVEAGDGDDLIRINGESGNDSIIYDVSQGNDQVFIDGGTGSDTLKINAGGLNFTVFDAQGQVLYRRGTGGSVITVRNVECIQVIAQDGSVLYQHGCTSWNPLFSGVGVGSPSRVAVDASGNIYIVGTSYATWAQTPVRAYQGGSDAFVARVNTSGVLQWVTFLGGTFDDEGSDIAVSGSDVFVVGTSYAAWVENPVRPFQGGRDAFVAKLHASSGVLVWHTFLGGAGEDVGNGIALDASGNIYLTGTSSATWGLSPNRPFSGLRDGFAAKLSAVGTLQWNTFLGGEGIDEGTDIATDGSANIYVIGSSTDGWSEIPVRSHSGVWDAFTVKLSSDGTLQWHTFLGGEGQEQGYAIIAETGGDSIYATGSSTASWGSPLNAFSGWEDGFVVKLNGSGVLQWHTFLGGEWNDRSDGLALDSAGNLYVKGSSDAAWGAPVSDYNAGYDAYVVKLTPTGAMQMLTFVGGEGDDFGDGIAVDASGSIILAGMSDAVWGEPVQSYGDTPHAFALKLNASGELQWNTFFGGTPWVTAHATGNGSGSISSDPAGISFNYPENTSVGASFDHGTDVLLTATASTGSTIAWTTCSGTISGNGTTQATCTFSNLDSEKTAEATFTLNQYTLTVNKAGTGTGTVTSTPAGINCGGDCNEDYNHGTVVTLTATPGSFSTFSGWSGDCSGTNPTTNVTMNANKTCTATFTAWKIILIAPDQGATYTACSYYTLPLFKWDTTEVFKSLEIHFSSQNNFATLLKVRGKPELKELSMTSFVWKKVLLLPGPSGGTVYWRVVGTKADRTVVMSNVRSFNIEEPKEVGSPKIAPTSIAGLPTLSWTNNCNIKFKVWFGNDPDCTKPGIKKKALTFNISNPNDNGGVFTKQLTSGQWTSIHKLVGSVPGSVIYWYVESWDVVKRYKKTSVMSFTLDP